MRAAKHDVWAEPRALSPNGDDLELDFATELDEGAEYDDSGQSLLGYISNTIIKLSLSVVLLLCVGLAIFSFYKLAHSFKPLVQRVVCETPAAPEAVK